MNKLEQSAGSEKSGIGTIILTENTFQVPPQFPEGSTIVQHSENRFYIYDPTCQKRWEISNHPPTWEHIQWKEVGLYGRTSGGTWHLLMGVSQATDANTQKIRRVLICVDAMTGEDWGNTTPNREIYYSTECGGHKKLGHGGGYYGNISQIQQDIEGLHALGITLEQFPDRIDIYATGKALFEQFNQGSFEPPQFVLPQENIQKSVIQLARLIKGK